MLVSFLFVFVADKRQKSHVRILHYSKAYFFFQCLEIAVCSQGHHTGFLPFYVLEKKARMSHVWVVDFSGPFNSCCGMVTHIFTMEGNLTCGWSIFNWHFFLAMCGEEIRIFTVPVCLFLSLLCLRGQRKDILCVVARFFRGSISLQGVER